MLLIMAAMMAGFVRRCRYERYSVASDFYNFYYYYN